MRKGEAVTAKYQLKNRKNAVAGIIAIAIVLLAAFFLLKYFHKPAVKTSPTYSAGVIKLNEVLKTHPRYNDLLKLYSERESIAAEMRALPADPSAAKLTDDMENAFVDFAQQKNDMGIQIMNSNLQDEMIAKEKDLRAQIADSMKADIKKENDKYENAIVNCSLKLDNAESLRLTPDEVNNLQGEMAQLKNERAAKVNAVVGKYENYVQAELHKYYAERVKYFQGVLAQKNADNLAGVDAQQTAFKDKRDAMIKEQTDEIAERKKSYIALWKKLDDKNSEIKTLRESMINDIASKASMFAVMYHLDVIYADPEDELDEIFSTDDEWDSLFDNQVVTTASVRDITGDVIKQMQDAD